MRRFILALSCILMMLATPISTQDFQKGLEAAESGDFETAFKEWIPLAEGGDRVAQNNLGVMYRNGWGVLSDQFIAHMWYNIAAANGNEKGAENREKLTKLMTPEDISKAEAMARACYYSNYDKCGY